MFAANMSLDIRPDALVVTFDSCAALFLDLPIEIELLAHVSIKIAGQRAPGR